MKNISEKTVVIMGQRRSGTSMLAGILHYLGVSMGVEPGTEEWEETNQETWANPKGFFEDRGIIKISERILEYARSGQVTEDQIIEKFRDDIEKIIEKRSQDKLWGFKDVNQVELHPLYKPYLKNPHYIFIFRNPICITKSLIDWHSYLDFDLVLQLVNRSNLRLSKMFRKYEASMALSFEESTNNPPKAVGNITDFLDIDVDDEDFQKAVDHISPSYRHY